MSNLSSPEFNLQNTRREKIIHSLKYTTGAILLATPLMIMTAIDATTEWKIPESKWNTLSWTMVQNHNAIISFLNENTHNGDCDSDIQKDIREKIDSLLYSSRYTELISDLRYEKAFREERNIPPSKILLKISEHIEKEQQALVNLRDTFQSSPDIKWKEIEALIESYYNKIGGDTLSEGEIEIWKVALWQERVKDGYTEQDLIRFTKEKLWHEL